MVQILRRLDLFKFDIDRYGMALISTDQCFIFIERVPLLIISSNNLFKYFPIDLVCL